MKRPNRQRTGRERVRDRELLAAESEERRELALRNRLIRKYPLEEYPLPGADGGDEHAADVLANMAAMGK